MAERVVGRAEVLVAALVDAVLLQEIPVRVPPSATVGPLDYPPHAPFVIALIALVSAEGRVVMSRVNKTQHGTTLDRASDIGEPNAWWAT